MKIIAFFLIAAFLISCSNHKDNDEHKHMYGDPMEGYPSVDNSDDHSQEHDHSAEMNAHGVITVSKKNFYETLHVSGQIMPSQKGQAVLAARHNGLVVFDNDFLVEGQEVKKGQKLFLISAQGLTHNNIEAKYAEVKNEYEKALQDYERAQKLLEEKIISQSEYQERKVVFNNTKTRYELIRKNYTKGGQPVYSPVSGFISSLYVREGEYVELGKPLASIVEDKHLVLKADVPQDMLSQLKFVKTASFSPSYNDNIYNTDSLNGQLLSIGKSAGASVYTPVYFEIDFIPDLFPGAFTDIYLHARPQSNVYAIPTSALLEELDFYYVFIFDGHKFSKRYVSIGGTDGNLVAITDGIKEGESVATKDVFRIRLSQMSGAMPAHAHNHAH